MDRPEGNYDAMGPEGNNDATNSDSVSTLSYQFPWAEKRNNRESEYENPGIASQNNNSVKDDSSASNSNSSKPKMVIIQHERRGDYNDRGNEGAIIDADKYRRGVEEADENKIDPVPSKRKKRKDKMEWEASVECDTKIYDGIKKTSTHSSRSGSRSSSSNSSNNSSSNFSDGDVSGIGRSNIGIGTNASKERNNDYRGGKSAFSFRSLKEQRNASIYRLMKDANNSSSNQSTTSDGSDMIGSNSRDRYKLREELTAQISSRFGNQNGSFRDEVSTSIRRAISVKGLLSVEDEQNDDDDDDKDDDNSSESSISEESDKSENKENVKCGWRKRLRDTIMSRMVSRRGYIVSAAICVFLLLIGNIVLVVLWAVNKN